MKELTLIKITNPFVRTEREISTIPLLEDKTLLDVRNEYFPKDVDVIVSINGEVIPTEKLALARPMPNDCILFIPAVHDGGDDKSILRMVAMIALMVALPQGMALWMKMGIMMAGSLLVNAVLPPPKPELPHLDNALDSQSYSWNPQSVQQQGVVIPKVYGVNKLFGNIITAYLSSDGTKQYANALIGLAMGPLKRIYDLKINDQSVDAFQGVDRAAYLGLLHETRSVPFDETKLEYPVQIKVDEGTPFTYTTIGTTFDKLEIELSFPQGLWWINNMGQMDIQDCTVRVSIRKQGESNWTIVTKLPTMLKVTAGNYWSLGRWSDPFSFLPGTPPGFLWFEYQAGDSNAYSHTEGERQAAGDPEFFWRWVGPPPPPLSFWWMVTFDTYQDYITIRGNQTAAVRKTLYAYNLPHGRYEIKIEKVGTSPTHESFPHMDDLYLTSVREVTNDVFEYPRLALVGIKALATDQLSGMLRFSCLAEGAYVRIYDGAAWSYGASSNPGWCFWDALTLPVIEATKSDALLAGYEYYDADTSLSLRTLRYDGIDPSRIDLPKVKEWADWCDELVPDGNGGTEKRITFNGVFDASTTMWQAALQICQVGRAVPVWIGSRITVAVDKPATAVQMFGVGNIKADSFKETFLPMEDRAGELSIDFANAENDYARDKFTVFDADAAVPNPLDIQLFGVTKPSEAWRAGMYRLYGNRYLTRTAEFDVDVDAIACTVGDVVNVQHDVPQWGFGGRVVAADANTVTLDRQVVIEAGKTYGIMVRLSNDTLVTKTTTNAPGTYTVLTVSTPFSAVPAQYDLYAFGETAKIVKPFRVIDLTKSQELTRTITAIEYNESIYNCDTEQPALPTPNYSALDALPPVTDLVLDELLLARQDGGIEDTIDVYFTPPASAYYREAEIWYSAGADWLYAGSAVSGRYRIHGVNVGMTYTVAVVTVNVIGGKAKIQNAPQATINTLGKLDPPSNVAGFSAVQNGQFVNFSWQHIPDADLWGYELRQGSAWEGARVIASGVSADQYSWQAELNGTYRFLIKAIDSSELYSTTAAQVDLTLARIDENINVIISQDEITRGGGPDGTKTNFVFVDDTVDYLSMPHMLLDTDVPSWTDTTPEITGYTGGITLSAEYITLAIDTLKIGDTWTRILDTFDAFDRGATDQSYPDRTDQSYPQDTDTHITMPVTKAIYLSYSSNGSSWSDWEQYFGTVQHSYRYVKIKYDVTVTSTTGVFKLLDLLIKLDVPDVELIIAGFSITTGTGNDILFSTYSTQFYSTPVITATLIGGTVNKVPVVSSKSVTGFHIDLRDKTDASVAGTVDIRVSGY